MAEEISMSMMNKGMSHLSEITVALSMFMMGYYVSTEINQSSNKKFQTGTTIAIMIVWVVLLSFGVERFVKDKNNMMAIGISVGLILGGLLVVLLSQFL